MASEMLSESELNQRESGFSPEEQHGSEVPEAQMTQHTQKTSSFVEEHDAPAEHVIHEDKRQRGSRIDGEYEVDENGNGKGKIVSPNGDVYVGEFLEWRRHGAGVQTWATGERYEGTWSSDQQWEGVFTSSTGDIWKGNFATQEVTLVQAGTRSVSSREVVEVSPKLPQQSRRLAQRVSPHKRTARDASSKNARQKSKGVKDIETDSNGNEPNDQNQTADKQAIHHQVDLDFIRTPYQVSESVAVQGVPTTHTKNARRYPGKAPIRNKAQSQGGQSKETDQRDQYNGLEEQQKQSATEDARTIIIHEPSGPIPQPRESAVIRGMRNRLQKQSEAEKGSSSSKDKSDASQPQHQSESPSHSDHPAKLRLAEIEARLASLPSLAEVGLEVRTERLLPVVPRAPGPGYYDPDFKVTKKRSPKVPLGLPGVHTTDAAVLASISPGPAYYPNLDQVVSRAPSHTFAASYTFVADECLPQPGTIGKSPLPGPGAYVTIVDRKGKRLLGAGGGVADAPSTRFPQASRSIRPGFEFISKKHNRELLNYFSPGPAAYSLPDSLDQKLAFGTPHAGGGPRAVTITGKGMDTMGPIVPTNKSTPSAACYSPYAADYLPGVRKTVLARNAPAFSLTRASKLPDVNYQPGKQVYLGKEFASTLQTTHSPGPRYFYKGDQIGKGGPAVSFTPHSTLRPIRPVYPTTKGSIESTRRQESVA